MALRGGGNYLDERDRLARKEHFTLQILQAYEEDIVHPLMQLQGLKAMFPVRLVEETRRHECGLSVG
jgi:hypothetical protein